jgi:hypothetical protein
MDTFTIDDVFQSVILTTLKSSENSCLRTEYDQILDDPGESVLFIGTQFSNIYSTVDNDKDLTFAHIQTFCTRQFHQGTSGPPHRSDTPRTTPRTLPAKPEKSNKYKYQRGYEHVASSATPSDTNNMVFGQRKFSAEPDSLAMTGTSLMQSPPSSLQTSNTFRPRSLVTLTLMMTIERTQTPEASRYV